MSTNLYSRALEIVNSRRIAAKTKNDRRTEEIEKVIPQFAELNMMITQTNIDILKIISAGDKATNVPEQMKILETRNLQAQDMMRKLLVQNGYPEDYLDLKYTCSRCSDTGFVNGTRCSCLDETAGKLAVQELNESSPLKLSTFETFSLDYYRGKNTADDNDCYTTMMNNLAYCKEYVNTFSKDSANIFISGKTGLGKTHLSLAIAERLLSQNWNVLYGSTINFMDKIESEHFGRSEGDTLSVIMNADLLILDDLGTEYDKQFCVSTLYNIINSRLSMCLPTIISTNLTPAEVERRYEPRISSRIMSSYDYLKFSGSDVRRIKKANSLYGSR